MLPDKSELFSSLDVKTIMNLKILSFLLMIVSCGQKHAENMLLPSDQATKEEKEILSHAIDEIQAGFTENGVNVNIRSIPYHVSTKLPSEIAGICVYKENGDPVGIAINRRVLQEWAIKTPTYYGFLYKALLHEVGHCFFQREHDDGHLEIPDNLLSEDVIDLSVMVDGGRAIIPNVLWPYYVREVAGLERINSLDDLQNFLRNSVP